MRVERIDLLFQLYCHQQDIIQLAEGDNEFVLPIDEILYRLDKPHGCPFWLEPADSCLHTEAVDFLNSRLHQLITRFHLSACEVDLLLAGLLPRLSAHYSDFLERLDPENGTGNFTREIWLNIHNSAQEFQSAQLAHHPENTLLVWRLVSELRTDCSTPNRRPFTTHVAVWRFLCGEPKLIADNILAVCEVKPDQATWCPPVLKMQLTGLWGQGNGDLFPLLMVEGRTDDGRELAIASAMAEIGVLSHTVDLTNLMSLSKKEQISLLTDMLRDSVLHKSSLFVQLEDVHREQSHFLSLLNRMLQKVPARVAILINDVSALIALPNIPSIQISMTPPLLEDKVDMLAQYVTSDRITKCDLRKLCLRYTFHATSVQLLVREADYYRRIRDEHACLSIEDLRCALSRRSRKNFGKLAKRITPQRSLDELLLAPEIDIQLREILAAIRWQPSLSHKRFNASAAGHSGISALFHGVSGTGKTMAAEALAHHLSTDLIKVDLSAVVNKYVGETEKNIARIFDLAETDCGVLFFDEADALFGKRSETKDAHDRHANIEVSYLLQRLEDYAGLIILATNNRSNLDHAFNRRFTFMTRFTFPDAILRERIWRSIWPSALSRGPVDYRRFAERAELTGASIRNVVQLSVVLARDDESDFVENRHIERAIQRELSKHGRLAL